MHQIKNTTQMEICFFISLALAFLLLLLVSNPTQINSSPTPYFGSASDEKALFAFKEDSIPRGAFYKIWSSNTSICYWVGVSCSTKQGRVTSLNVSNVRLQGPVSPHLANLTSLRSLDLSLNNFIGEIPWWLGALSQLQHLYLNNNSLSGAIPPSLSAVSRLQTLDLSYNSLSGSLPKEIGNLSYLETINLVGNQITGPIPEEMFNMPSLTEINMRYNRVSGKLPLEMCSNTTNSKLQRVYLTGNQIYGELPASIHKCTKLQDLRLANNLFSGSIPSEIGGLSMLSVLNLGSNKLTGSIPKQIGNMTSLTILELSYNKLTGEVRGLGISELPEEIGNLAYLQVFAAAYNDYLNGSIPSSIFNISTLMQLALQQNQFSGSLPVTMAPSPSNLQVLILSLNRLSGEIPSSITNASMLTVVELNRNSFTGLIPNLGRLRFLQSLRLWENNLTGALSPTQHLSFLTSLTNCPDLEHLELTDNPLNGILPPSVGNLSNSLQSFMFSDCNINGPIPPGFGNLKSLQFLHLAENQLTGSIPTTLGKLSFASRILLGGNRLRGHIPSDLCQLGNLGELNLSMNVLTGPIPECLGEMTSLIKVSFASNNLSFTIPSTFWNLRDLIYLDLSSNNLSGQVSLQIGNLKAINILDMSSNHFSGHIPTSIKDCLSLVYLSLSSNQFTGSIPESFGNLRGLTTLDLSNNNLSGIIPSSLEALTDLQDFNVAHNKLGGEIPNGGRFASFTAESFSDNSALCSVATRRLQVRPCAEQDHGRSKRISRLMKYIVPPFVTVIILMLLIILVLHRRRKQTKERPPAEDISLWRRISYMELVRGTASFNDTNLIGRGSFGSVFKATLSDGLNVAVKVFNLQREGASKSFDTESEILSSIRHRNLVRIIGCCTNTEFKALILAYMPNGSLEKCLYSDHYHLGLVQRLNIAIDVALALEYLHHNHTFAVVHCDLKPSNVLLDENMIAHVGDFGISKLFDEGEAMAQTKTFATVGYAAPEYGSEGKVSTSGDVYSYGIMLVEMFTCKKPTDDMFGGEMSMKEWVIGAIQENATRGIVAPGLLLSRGGADGHLFECVSSIFHLAIKCLAFLPEERVNMIQVVAALQKIKAKAPAPGVDSMRRNRR